MTFTRKYRTTLLATIFTVGALLSTLFAYTTQQNASAADVRQFNPGNIMSDAVMSNKNSMSAQQIQQFLNSKNACNNRNTHLAAQYPHLQYNIRDGRFVCMAQERFNGKSAAQIIWQVGQDYNINPQVLIVLLEKEQGLISDTWPNHVQYRTATGFGCPDTAPCASQYFGLENQLKLAAQLFRGVLNGGWSNYPVGHTYVQYHPNASCGGSVIHIQNRATSALYRYTPYQPNQSALNAGYGAGNSCGAYGNRNFWMLFTDWFGSTQGSGFVKLDTPRWKQVKSDNTNKIEAYSNRQLSTPVLSSGTQLYFPDKTKSGGKWLLRTQFDRSSNIHTGINQSDLEEIPYQPITSKWVMLKTGGNKSHPSSRTTTGDLLQKDLSIEVVDKIDIDNNTYYRTKYDRDNGLDKGIHEKFLTDYTVMGLEEPRDFCATSAIEKVNPQTGKVTAKTKSLKFSIARKTLIGGVWYFQDKSDAGSMNFIDSRELNDRCYVPFEEPRTMRLNKNTDRIDMLTGGVYDKLPNGMRIALSTKIQVGSTWYYRTKHNTDHGIDAVIPAKNFSEL